MPITNLYIAYKQTDRYVINALLQLRWRTLQIREIKSMACVQSAECDLLQIELSTNYGLNEWHDDLKEVMLTAGVENNRVVFLFSDTQVYCLDKYSHLVSDQGTVSRRGQDIRSRLIVCLSVCLSVCLFVHSITQK